MSRNRLQPATEAPPSLHDVAREAGVSIATVSRALHGTHPVAAATRARVNEVVARLGYRPNRVARSLRTRRTQTVGMLVMHFRNPAVAPYVEGAESVLDAAGYSLVVASTHEGADAGAGRLERLAELRADGLIVNVQAPALLHHLQEVAIDRPVVLANAFADELPAAGQLPPWLAAVVVDEEAASAKATSHLLSLGHRRVALFQSSTVFWNAAQRLRGYRHALQAAGQPFDPALVVEHDPPGAPADDVVRQLLTLHDPPTAAYVAPDSVAKGFVHAARAAAVAVPAQLAVVAYAVGEWMEFAQPQLTAIELPAYEIGAKAAHALLHLLDRAAPEPSTDATDPNQPQPVTVVQAPLVIRESCGTPPDHTS